MIVWRCKLGRWFRLLWLWGVGGDVGRWVEAIPEEEPFDGEATRFRLGIEAMRLALAYEYDPYFAVQRAKSCIWRTTSMHP
jgi:hypothetical protein